MNGANGLAASGLAMIGQHAAASSTPPASPGRSPSRWRQAVASTLPQEGNGSGGKGRDGGGSRLASILDALGAAKAASLPSVSSAVHDPRDEQHVQTCEAMSKRTQDLKRQLEEQALEAERAVTTLRARKALRTAFAAFKAAYGDSMALERAMRALLALQQRRVFNTWTHAADFVSRARRQLRTAASSMRSIGLRKAFNSWSEAAVAVACARRQLQAAAASMRSVGVRKAFNSWSAAAVSVSCARRQLQAAATSMRSVGLRKAFNSWSDIAGAVSCARRRLQAAATSMRSVGLRKAFNSWSDVAATASKARCQLLAAATSMRSTGLRRAFNTWSSCSAARHRAISALRGAAFALRASGLVKAFRSWAATSATVSGLERTAYAAGRMLSGGTRRALLIWSTYRLHMPCWSSCDRGLRLRRAAVSLALADAVARRFYHWRLGLSWRSVQRVQRAATIAAEREKATRCQLESARSKLSRVESYAKATADKLQKAETELQVWA